MVRHFAESAARARTVEPLAEIARANHRSIAGGPDVWELVRDLKHAAAAGASNPIEAVTKATGVDRSKVGLAAAYDAAYPDDIDERIRTEEQS